jgi:hypothetical protein
LAATATMQDALSLALGGGRLLAIARVKDSKLVSASPGVALELNPKTNSGTITFPNPKNLKVVPVISDANDAPYITNMHYVSNIQNNNFSVRRKAMDTGDRTYLPTDFTAIVVGFDEQPIK